MREFVLVSGNIRRCYCGNAKDFGDCTRDGYPRQNPRAVASAGYAVALRPTRTGARQRVERCYVETTRLRCQCGRMVSKALQAWAGRLDGRLRALRTQDPIHSGLVVGKVVREWLTWARRSPAPQTPRPLFPFPSTTLEPNCSIAAHRRVGAMHVSSAESHAPGKMRL